MSVEGASPDIEALLAALSPEEKLSLVAGADLWHTATVPRLGIPAMRFTDGPHGARGTHVERGPTSAALPVATALAATWDVDLIRQVGELLAVEARDKGAHVVLAPTLNLHRFPLAGRNFECFSEDPVLAARMAVAIVAGLQARGVGATAKHFVGNDSEHQRHVASSEIGARALRELYLVPFEAAVAEAGAWAVMTAYNRLNGLHSAANPWLVTDLLKGEWGFDGLVMSDWHGTYRTVGPAQAGLDLEMPGPPQFFGAPLADAIAEGTVASTILDDKARRVLRTAVRTGAFVDGGPGPERAVDRPEAWAFLRRVAADGMVVVRNDGLLPIRLEGVQRVAVIGPNAASGQVMGGGSSQVRPHRVSQPLDALLARVGGRAVVAHEPGCLIHRLTPPLPDADHVVSWFDGAGAGRDGAATESGGPATSAPLHVDRSRSIGLPMGGPPVPGLRPDGFSVRWESSFVPVASGLHTFGATAIGRVRVAVDDEVVVDNWAEPRPGHTFYGFGSAEVQGGVTLDAGRPVRLRVDYGRDGGQFPAVRVGMLPPPSADLLERAVGAARGADLAIVVVGSNAEWETEGSDRVSFDLPGRQDELVDAVLDVNRNTVVVVNAGSPVAMHWADRCPAVVVAWYPGMAFGEALADVLFGDVNPSGRLPTTFPRRLEDHPAYLNYPGEGGQVVYGEGVFAGYRGFDARDIEPLFAFGHGLSYTTFAYGPLRLVAHDPVAHTASVALDVTNTGPRAGAEVVQLYVADHECRLARPPKELRAFTKLLLGPGQTGTVRFELGPRAFAFWDPDGAGWTVEAGQFDLLVGASSRDIRARTTLPW